MSEIERAALAISGHTLDALVTTGVLTKDQALAVIDKVIAGCAGKPSEKVTEAIARNVRAQLEKAQEPLRTRQ